jgi:hypothetical protein
MAGILKGNATAFCRYIIIRNELCHKRVNSNGQLSDEEARPSRVRSSHTTCNRIAETSGTEERGIFGSLIGGWDYHSGLLYAVTRAPSWNRSIRKKSSCLSIRYISLSCLWSHLCSLR